MSERQQAEATRQELARLEAGRAAEVQAALDHVRAEQLRLQEERAAERRGALADWEARQAEVRVGGKGGREEVRGGKCEREGAEVQV